MPLTTRHQDGRRIDSTNAEHWTEVHVAGYSQLFCPECRAQTVAVDRREVINYFRHLVNPDGGCGFGVGESDEHRHVKVLVAAAVRELNGWTAEIESPGEGWRADVLAVGPSGRRIAFEPQFSAIAADKAAERTERHRASGLETVWLDAQGRSSLFELPTVRLFYDAGAPRIAIRTISQRGKGMFWSTGMVSLAQFVTQVCLGRITYAQFWATSTDRKTWQSYLGRCERERADAARNADALAEFHRKHATAQEEQRQRDEKARAERQAQLAREEEERRARAQRDRDERRAREGAMEPWHIPSKASDEDVLALCTKYVASEKPFPGWVLVGDRLHAELSRRELLHG